MGRPRVLSPAWFPLQGPRFGDLVEWQALLQGAAVGDFCVLAARNSCHGATSPQRVPLIEASQGLPLAARPPAASSCCPQPGHGCSTQTKHSVRSFWGRVVPFGRGQGLGALPTVVAVLPVCSAECVIPWARDVCCGRSWRLDLIPSAWREGSCRAARPQRWLIFGDKRCGHRMPAGSYSRSTTG